MKKKPTWQIYEETPIKFGVYVNKKTKKIAIASKPKDEKFDFSINKGKVVTHPIFKGMKVSISEQGTGNYFFNKSLRSFEFLCEEVGEYKAGKVYVS